jgi:hypothetical protein
LSQENRILQEVLVLATLLPPVMRGNRISYHLAGGKIISYIYRLSDIDILLRGAVCSPKWSMKLLVTFPTASVV